MDRPAPGTQDSAIEVRRLTKSFGDHFALKGLDLDVRRGESLAIFGPNGAGKTTLIKILAAIMNPSSGEVLIDGLSTKDSTHKVQRRIGVVSHHTFLYANLTAYENLKFYSRMYDVPTVDERIREVVEMVGMTSRLNDQVGTFSRGMQQRLSIARSLLHRPSIMLLDEPETGLDQQATSILWKVMRPAGGEERTIVFSTHSLERGWELADRFIVLNKGWIVFENTKHGLGQDGLREAYQRTTGASV
ncbi:MAG: ABC transporter ATP-binding protein [Chloroflexota bacterium]